MTLSTLMLVAALNPGAAVLLIVLALAIGAAAGLMFGTKRAKQDVDAQIQSAEARGVSKGIEQRKRDRTSVV